MALLGHAHLPESYAAIQADGDLGIARGELLVTSGDLSTCDRPAGDDDA